MELLVQFDGELKKAVPFGLEKSGILSRIRLRTATASIVFPTLNLFCSPPENVFFRQTKRLKLKETMLRDKSKFLQNFRFHSVGIVLIESPSYILVYALRVCVYIQLARTNYYLRSLSSAYHRLKLHLSKYFPIKIKQSDELPFC